MYVIVETGGKQFKAAKDDVLIVEKIDGEVGETVDLGNVLMVVDGGNVKVGSPRPRDHRAASEGEEDRGFQLQAEEEHPQAVGPSPAANLSPHHGGRGREVNGT
jgi:hypothetical protein